MKTPMGARRESDTCRKCRKAGVGALRYVLPGVLRRWTGHSSVSVLGGIGIEDEEEWGRAPLGPSPGWPDRSLQWLRRSHIGSRSSEVTLRGSDGRFELEF